nr:immunoglobulin heavy chain junction region [Macaca mulatta]
CVRDAYGSGFDYW